MPLLRCATIQSLDSAVQRFTARSGPVVALAGVVLSPQPSTCPQPGYRLTVNKTIGTFTLLGTRALRLRWCLRMMARFRTRELITGLSPASSYSMVVPMPLGGWLVPKPDVPPGPKESRGAPCKTTARTVAKPRRRRPLQASHTHLLFSRGISEENTAPTCKVRTQG